MRWLYVAWWQAIVATLGSLYFSEIAKFPPCKLCWFQRVFMYPLVLILLIGLMRKDRKIWQYVVALAVPGWAIALYHNLLYYGILEESAASCEAGVSCTTRFFAWFGFVTIPLLSFVAFSVILVCMWKYRSSQKSGDRSQEE